MGESQTQQKNITPEELVERSRLKTRYKLAKSDADLMERARKAGSSAEFLEAIEEHCLKSFEVWALETVPLAKSFGSPGVHSDYVEVLKLIRERVLRELSSYTSSFIPTGNKK
jgi:hypothetical protein